VSAVVAGTLRKFNVAIPASQNVVNIVVDRRIIECVDHRRMSAAASGGDVLGHVVDDLISSRVFP
jgi:hypothetical protein